MIPAGQGWEILKILTSTGGGATFNQAVCRMTDMFSSLPCDSSVCSSESARNAIINLLRAVEKKPLRCKDLAVMKESIAETIKAFNLVEDDPLLALIDKRCSFEFIPGVSSIGLEIVPEIELQTEDIAVQLVDGDGNNGNKKKESDNLTLSNSVSTGADTFGADVLGKYGNKRIYLMCSVRRQQTALWTSYRLFLDGTREFDNSGALSSPTMNDQPISLLGAKKFKSGIGAQSLIWDLPDTKQWKEKNAIGRITRLPNAIYSGVQFAKSSCSNIVSGNQQSSASPLPLSASGSGTTDQVNESSTAPISPSDRVNYSTESIESNGGVGKGGGGAAVTGSTGGVTAPEECNPGQVTRTRSASKMWNFVGTPTTSPTSATAALGASNGFGNGGGGISTAASASVRGVDNTQSVGACAGDGGIVLSVVCKGMDKLIYLNGVAERKITPTEAISSNNSSITEIQLQSKLDTLLRKDTPPHSGISSCGDGVSNDDVILLRSKLPRKTPAAGGKTTHTVAFSKINRVGVSSRKNIVVEAVSQSSGITEAVDCAAEWGDETELPALLQFGKRDEGLYTLDFYDLTPFQAFCIALAAFDH